jgi:hypothetical protein
MASGVLSTGIALRPTLVATVVEDGAVLLDLETKYFYKVNASGWAILQLFELQSAREEDVLDRCRSWGATPADEAQIRAFLDRCKSEQLVEQLPAGDPAPVEYSGAWSAPSIERQAEPLQGIVTSAFDPSIPLAE